MEAVFSCLGRAPFAETSLEKLASFKGFESIDSLGLSNCSFCDTSSAETSTKAYLLGSVFISVSSLTLVADDASDFVAGGDSTFVAETSTVTTGCGVRGGGDEALEADAEDVGNGKGDPGENAALLNWLFSDDIWPIKVLKACCIAYFFRFVATHENNAERPTPTPIQKRGDPIVDGGGGTDNCGLTPTEVVSLELDDEMLAKVTDSNFFSTPVEVV